MLKIQKKIASSRGRQNSWKAHDIVKFKVKAWAFLPRGINVIGISVD